MKWKWQSAEWLFQCDPLGTGVFSFCTDASEGKTTELQLWHVTPAPWDSSLSPKTDTPEPPNSPSQWSHTNIQHRRDRFHSISISRGVEAAGLRAVWLLSPCPWGYKSTRPCKTLWFCSIIKRRGELASLLLPCLHTSPSPLHFLFSGSCLSRLSQFMLFYLSLDLNSLPLSL